MDVPGGVVTRPLKKWYDPTFWPVQQFVHLRDRASNGGFAALLGMPGAVSCSAGGRVELVALRNAVREKMYGLMPIPAMPATGHERYSYTFEYALLFTESGGWRENSVDVLSRQIIDDAHADDGLDSIRALVKSLVTVDSDDIAVTSIKSASRGGGFIVRLLTYAATGKQVSISMRDRTLVDAYLCDSRERDLSRLNVDGGVVHLVMPGSIATARIICD